MKKISFIIPVYNVEKYIDKCIQSIVVQTIKDIEIIIINDCSTDNSINIIKKWKTKESRIKVYNNKKNRGLSFSRNKGLAKATGEYIWFIDSDDIIVNEKAAEQLYFEAVENKLELLQFDAKCFFENDDLKQKYGELNRLLKNKEIGINGQDLFSKQVFSSSLLNLTQLFFLKSSLLKNNNLSFAQIVHEDMLFSVQAMICAERAGYVPHQYYGYFRRSGSITTSKNNIDIKAASCAYIVSELYLWFKKRNIKYDTVYALIKYIKIMKDALVTNLLECMKQGKEVAYLRPIDLITSRDAIEEKYPSISHIITKETVTKIANAKKILVYGAGNISSIVQSFLIDIGFSDYNVVVTKVAPSDNDVLNLSDFKDEDVLLLISVRPELQEEMISYAKSLGFNEYVKMT